MGGFWEYLQRPDTPFGVADVVYAGLLLYGIVRGAIRGVSGEIAATLGTIVVFLASWYYHRPVGDFLLRHTRLESETAGRLLSYVLLALLFFATWKLATLVIRLLFQKAVPDHVERPLGALLGFAKMFTTLCILLVAAGLTGSHTLRVHLIERSAFGRVTQIWFPQMIERWCPQPPPPSPTPAPTPCHGS